MTRARSGGLGLSGEGLGVVRNEVATVPVALEHRSDLLDDVRIPRARHPDVPLQATDLSRVVKFDEPMYAVENPERR